jgi:arylsulfatase A-like enzyme
MAGQVPTRPNVLLIVLDTARRDAVEPYGAPAGATPTIADLAGRGNALSRAYSTASWTLPSHASMFTGLLPREVGLCQPPAGTPQGARGVLERLSDRMLPRVLSQAGYATQAWSTNVWASPLAGFGIGFDQAEYVTGGREEQVNALLSGGVRSQLAWAREGLRSRSDDGATAVGRALRESIAAWSGTPTFWFVNLSECHSPYLPPRPWNDLPPADRVRAALEAKRHLNFESICLYAARHHEIPEPAFERMRRLYQRAVSYMDSWLAGVLESLDARGILDETLVIVTSDHGENFGEGGLIAHGFSLDERLIHVPLVMAGPGTRVGDEVLSLCELPGLIADAAGLEEHPWSEREPPDGVAIAQYDPMGGRDHPKIREFADKFGLEEENVDRLCATYTCAVDGTNKLVLRDAAQIAYDLDADPGETNPLDAAALDGNLGRLRAALEHPVVTSTVVAEPPPPQPAGGGASAEELEAIEKQMKLLGYM